MAANLKQLEIHYKSQREQFSDDFRLRVHRSLSWLKQAEKTEELDFQFIALWVAFNAAYAKEIDNIIHDRASFGDFIRAICDFDAENKIYNLIWMKFNNSIRVLLENKYIFKDFWDFHNGKITENGWKTAFEESREKILTALKQKRTDRILSELFQRLYTLRNQVIHGGATFNSSVNREQLRDGCNILMFLIPVMLEIMMAHHNEIEWGKPFYPVVK